MPFSVDAHPTATIAHDESIVAVFWHQGPTVPAIERLTSVLGAQSPGGVLCAVIEATGFDDLKDISSDARKRFAAITRDNPFTGGVVVVEGQGFAAASIRMICAGIMLVSRPGYPVKVVSSLPAAGEWLSRWTRRDVGDVNSALDRARVQSSPIATSPQPSTAAPALETVPKL